MTTAPPDGPDVLVVRDAAVWRAWLDAHEDDTDGVWLLLAKKGATSPTSLGYAEALDEALCSGWIDGQRNRVDEATYRQRFTPRRPRSLWSARNVEHVARLRDEGRMRPRGEAEVRRAQDDGRWDAAYAGPATITVPDDLAAALDRAPRAREVFERLTRQDRYAVLHRVVTATRPEVRARRIERAITSLADRAPDA